MTLRQWECLYALWRQHFTQTFYCATTMHCKNVFFDIFFFCRSWLEFTPKAVSQRHCAHVMGLMRCAGMPPALCAADQWAHWIIHKQQTNLWQDLQAETCASIDFWSHVYRAGSADIVVPSNRLLVCCCSIGCGGQIGALHVTRQSNSIPPPKPTTHVH